VVEGREVQVDWENRWMFVHRCLVVCDDSIVAFPGLLRR